MTISEVSLLIVAIAAVTTCITVLYVGRRMLPVLRRSDRLLRRSNRTMRRVNAIAYDLEDMARDARRLEGRFAKSAHGLLDDVEPLWRALRAVLAGTRTGIGTLFTHNGDGPRRHRRHHRLERERSMT